MTDRARTARSRAQPGALRGRRWARRRSFAVGILAVTLVLGGCGQEEGPVGSPDELVGEVIADAALYPGQPGGMVGASARTEEEVVALWSAVGFSGAAPVEDDGIVVVVAGGESGTCPWNPQGARVSDDGDVVTVDLGERGEDPCTDDWHPRSVAVSLPAERISDDPEIRALVDGAEQSVDPLDIEGADEHRAQEPGDDPAAGDAFLFVEAQVWLSDDGDPATRTFACDADGTSHEGDPDEACAALVDQQSWLLEGDPADQVCTQVYGGPEVAELRGHVGGEAFERRLDRTDGCGIQRWEQLEAALGEPSDGHQEPVTE